MEHKCCADHEPSAMRRPPGSAYVTETVLFDAVENEDLEAVIDVLRIDHRCLPQVCRMAYFHSMKQHGD